MAPRKNKYLDIYLDRRLKPILESCLKNEKIKRQLLKHNLRENAAGVAKLAVQLFLEDIDKTHGRGKSDSKAAE